MRARDEGFEQRGLGLAHCVHFADFEQPLAAQVLRHVFARRHVRQVIAEPFAAEHAARR
jgi:hypothetical protein